MKDLDKMNNFVVDGISFAIATVAPVAIIFMPTNICSVKMFLGVSIALAAVGLYTMFGILEQYFNLNLIDLILGRACVQIVIVSVVLVFKRKSMELCKSAFIAGIILFICTSSLVLAIHILPLGLSAILTHTTAGFTALFARLLAKEHISLLKVIAIIFIFLGQILVVQPSFLMTTISQAHPTLNLGSMEYIGIGAGLLCACTDGLLAVFVALNNTSKEQTLFFSSFLSLILGLIVSPFITEYQIFHGPSTNFWNTVIQSLFVGSIAFLAMGAFIASIGLCPSVLLGLISSAECVTSFIAQTMFFKQGINFVQSIGVFIVMLSLIGAILIDSSGKQLKNQQGYLSLEANNNEAHNKSKE